jgi:putative ABC transport system permease protein
MRRSGGRPLRLREAITGHFIFSVRTALEAVSHNKLRASLTSLGILFGVASVIAMLAIGKGAEQEILEQMQQLGSNNVIVMPLVKQTEEDLREDQQERQVERVSPGLTRADASAIAEVIPAVDATSGEIVLNTAFTREGLRRSGKVVGVDTTYFPLMNLDIASGRPFSIEQVERGMPVAIIGHGVRSRFFTTEEALGRRIKVGNVWVTVIGVLEDRRFRGDASLRLGIRDANMDVYVPITTMLRRFRDRTRVTQRDIELASRPRGMPDENGAGETDEQRTERTNRNQLDRIVVRVSQSSLVPGVADVIQRILERRHNTVVDFEITVPEALLRQEQRTKTIFNIVLGAIASISLVVGGIGIMNIMLASILERIQEIGVRRAVGATRREILLQFLSEAVLISLAGGVAGILVGAGLSSGIERAAGIATVVSYLSVLVAFGVAVAVGLVFGIVPAYRAAHQDPVTCLRHE